MSVTTSYQVKLWKLTGGSRRWCRRRTTVCKFYHDRGIVRMYCTGTLYDYNHSELALLVTRVGPAAGYFLRIAPGPSPDVLASTSSTCLSLPSRTACGCSRRARAALASTFLDESLPAVPAAAQVAPETAPGTHTLLTPRFAASSVWKKGSSSPLSLQRPETPPKASRPSSSSSSVQSWR
jgi:hypothetical protein